MMNKEERVLEVSDLTVHVQTAGSFSTLVRDVNFSLEKGKILGLVGESGSGKTVTSMSLMQLHDRKTTRVEGSIRLNGQELNDKGDSAMRTIRGKDIAYIMQNPMNAFTPVFTIGHQFAETIRTHMPMTKKQAERMAVDVMNSVNLPEPVKLLRKYPFELSGGMLQRVMIAMAVSLNPSVLIADEPTTALDLHNQLLVLRLLDKVRTEYGTAILLISHDLGVIAEMADRVMVMKQGCIVESSSVMQLFDHPQHDYTKTLLRTRPSFYSEKQPYPFNQ